MLKMSKEKRNIVTELIQFDIYKMALLFIESQSNIIIQNEAISNALIILKYMTNNSNSIFCKLIEMDILIILDNYLNIMAMGCESLIFENILWLLSNISADLYNVAEETGGSFMN